MSLDTEIRFLERAAIAEPSNPERALAYVRALARSKGAGTTKQGALPAPVTLTESQSTSLTRAWMWGEHRLTVVAHLTLRGPPMHVMMQVATVTDPDRGDEALISIRRVEHAPEIRIPVDRPLEAAAHASHACTCGHTRGEHNGSFGGMYPGPECSVCSCVAFRRVARCVRCNRLLEEEDAHGNLLFCPCIHRSSDPRV